MCFDSCTHGCGGQNRFGIPFWGPGAPLILELISVGVGMFTGGTIWILTHVQMAMNFSREPPPKWLVDMDPRLNGVHQMVPS